MGSGENLPPHDSMIQERSLSPNDEDEQQQEGSQPDYNSDYIFHKEMEKQNFLNSRQDMNNRSPSPGQLYEQENGLIVVEDSQKYDTQLDRHIPEKRDFVDEEEEEEQAGYQIVGPSDTPSQQQFVSQQLADSRSRSRSVYQDSQVACKSCIYPSTLISLIIIFVKFKRALRLHFWQISQKYFATVSQQNFEEINRWLTHQSKALILYFDTENQSMSFFENFVENIQKKFYIFKFRVCVNKH